jgi:hypothetical protein
MLQKLYSHVAEAIQQCCGGYIAMLRRLYSHVAEAIQSCCGGDTCLFTENNTTPTKFKLFWVVGWVVANKYDIYSTLSSEK